MRKKGFTLVELLAVIVVLAIILAIAIPSVLFIISNSRMNAFKNNGDMLKRATKTYYSVDGITLESGQTEVIGYTTIQDAGYISKITDPINNNECIHSKAYVKNNGGKYEYDTAILCDNYADIDFYNLIINHDFSNNTSNWTRRYSNIVINNKIYYNTADGSKERADFYQATSIPIRINDVYYTYARVRVTNTVSSFIRVLLADDVTWQDGILRFDNPVKDQWYDVSFLKSFSTVSGNFRLFIQHYYANEATANGKVMEVDGNYGVYLLNLTAMYGAGNEPSKAAMDIIINNMKK